MLKKPYKPCENLIYPKKTIYKVTEKTIRSLSLKSAFWRRGARIRPRVSIRQTPYKLLLLPKVNIPDTPRV